MKTLELSRRKLLSRALALLVPKSLRAMIIGR